MAIDLKLIDKLLADYKNPEDIIGENGLLKQLTKALLERAMQAELTEHLGYDLNPAHSTRCRRCPRPNPQAFGILFGVLSLT